MSDPFAVETDLELEKELSEMMLEMPDLEQLTERVRVVEQLVSEPATTERYQSLLSVVRKQAAVIAKVAERQSRIEYRLQCIESQLS
jgi:Trp operon repressor